MVILMRWALCITLIVCVSLTTPVSENTKTRNYMEQTFYRGQKVLDQSLQSLRELTSEIESAIDARNK